MAERLLLDHFGRPLDALWQALENQPPEVALAIVDDRRCGKERKGKLSESVNVSPYEAFDFSNVTPLILAVIARRLDVVRELLILGADYNAKESTYGYTALHVAACKGDPELIEVLAAGGANVSAVSAWNITPLHAAVIRNHIEAMETLILKGANVSAISKSGRTLLHDAARAGHAQAIELLVAKGAHLEAMDEGHNTPLHYAAKQAHLEAVNALITCGANINAVNLQDETPLQCTMAMRNFAPVITCMKLLVAQGADLNYRLHEGKKALHFAYLVPTLMVHLLLDNGADVAATDDYGATPLDVAISYRSERDHITLLRAHGAQLGAVYPEGHSRSGNTKKKDYCAKQLSCLIQ